eukprot:5975984-Amphidinium_carterae.1
MADEAANAAIIDTKGLVPKPARLTDERSRWTDWRFAMENYMTCINANYGSEMHFAVQQESLVTVSDPNPIRHAQITQRSATLYSILASLCTGKSLAIVKQLRQSRNGYEVWRKLVAEFEPRSDLRKLAALNEILEAGPLKVSIEQFGSGLIRWETMIDEYEEIPAVREDDALDATFAESLKRAILMRQAPGELGDYLRLTGASTYMEMRDTVESYLR